MNNHTDAGQEESVMISDIAEELGFSLRDTRQLSRHFDLTLKCLRQFMSGYTYRLDACQRPVRDEDLTLTIRDDDIDIIRATFSALSPAIKRRDDVARSLPVMNALGILVGERAIDTEHLLALSEISWERSAWSGVACTPTPRGTYTLGGVRQYGQSTYAHLRSQLAKCACCIYLTRGLTQKLTSEFAQSRAVGKVR
jgi:hypothetical protein